VKVFAWHDDTWDLPQNSSLLAKSTICNSQAFSYDNDRVLGLQFHPEMTISGAKIMLHSDKKYENLVQNFELDKIDNFQKQNEAFKQLLDTVEQLILFKKLENL